MLIILPREDHNTTERCLDYEVHGSVCVYLIYANLCPDSGPKSSDVSENLDTIYKEQFFSE